MFMADAVLRTDFCVAYEVGGIGTIVGTAGRLAVEKTSKFGLNRLSDRLARGRFDGPGETDATLVVRVKFPCSRPRTVPKSDVPPAVAESSALSASMSGVPASSDASRDRLRTGQVTAEVDMVGSV